LLAGDGSRGCEDINECMSNEHPANCEVGTHCVNTYGAFSCKTCNPACRRSAGCAGGTDSDCAECGHGYRREVADAESTAAEEEGVAGAAADAIDAKGRCVDIDECAEGKTCAEGKACVNGLGWAECQACHPTCATCTGTGVGECVTCPEGRARTDGGVCALLPTEEVTATEEDGVAAAAAASVESDAVTATGSTDGESVTGSVDPIKDEL